MAEGNVVQFAGVSKIYPRGLFRGRVAAVDNVDFAVPAGQVVGLIGPNRSGKTTLVKLLLTLARPTRGAVFRFGRPAHDRSTLRKIGYIPERPAFPTYLTARGLLHYFGALGFVSEAELNDRVPKLLDRVGVADRADEPIARFSKGMTQRLALAQALVGRPDLLIFDEPDEGLDLSGRELVRTVIAEHKSAGGSALVVSHVLPEVERLCDRLTVLNSGRIVYDGTLVDFVRDPATGQSRSIESALHARQLPTPN